MTSSLINYHRLTNWNALPNGCFTRLRGGSAQKAEPSALLRHLLDYYDWISLTTRRRNQRFPRNT
ncbi:hypothetical protein ABZ619_31680 [Streptomyces sp. NPDC007851]|uniref:hypothetical protein n=1 Tax=Streptomyces sp. NPDC007851 TaxID=3155008 RepID=UPI003400FF6A